MKKPWSLCVAAVCLMSIAASSTIQAVAASAAGSVGHPDQVLGGNVEIQVQPAHETGENGADLAEEAQSAVVMDASTGTVLFEKDAHERLPMASITKIMTMLLIMEAIDNGKLKWTDPVRTSEYAASMGGSQIFLQPGEVMSAADMLKGIAMASANDACVAMAEHIAGSADAFVAQMNARARALGMKDTHFVNCNGLPVPDHYSSAYDIAVMSRELLKHEQILRFTSAYSDYLRKDTDHPFWLVNTNKLVRYYSGVDGLKTGYTQEAKYCLAATAKKDGFRIITVVMGEPKTSVRNREVTELLNWGFANYTSKVLYRAGQTVQDIEFRHGRPESIPLVAADTVGVVMKKGEHHRYDTEVQLKADIAPPLRKGDAVGVLRVKEDGRVVASVPLLASTDVRKTGFLTGIGRTLRDFVTLDD
ncbi:D-alanyl-D-alanine carboxypeptidase [Alicyclobacillus contaminans]|uniref:D-alanyl-D-alanine carboxypeptidase family protein n=1 Tax=Alicyclobacillus contaminans TaxID=392016 RepID=UPI00047BB18D|nr:D-alanyl-D-alanine carboxypeptidase family protein [Alicyclobacillus contaminans]GMA52461.1 D-alanyl-D-alanine carboxypeptidase [Alicyclobacillus contaminans]